MSNFELEKNFSGIQEIKLGKSFSKSQKNNAYHTIRYDFKPASVDAHKSGSLEIVAKEVTLKLPLVPGTSSTQEAVFKGNKTPASKDCLLIIDHSTGELVLERITENVRVKKTRNETGNRKPIAPSKEKVSSEHSLMKNKSAALDQKKSNSKKPIGSMPLLDLDDAKDDSSSSESGDESSQESDSDSEKLQAAILDVKGDRTAQESPSILSDLELSEED